MDLESFRDYCLSLSGSTENSPWTDPRYQNLVTFSVAGKWFCLLDIENKFCDVKCNPSSVDELQDRYSGIQPAWHMNKTHWIKILLDSDVPQSEIQSLVGNAYNLIVARLSKLRRAECGISSVGGSGEGK